MQLVLLALFFASSLFAQKDAKSHHGGGNSGGSSTGGALSCPAAIAGPISMLPADWCVIRIYAGIEQPTATQNGWIFAFPPAPDSVVRVTENVFTSFAQTQSLSITFHLSANSAIWQVLAASAGCVGAPNADMSLYFEHANNTANVQDWRWWSGPELYVIQNGTYDMVVTLTVPLAPSNWSDANGQHGATDPTGFADTLANIGVVGIEIGSGCFYGHGTQLTSGTATMEVTNFSVQ